MRAVLARYAHRMQYSAVDTSELRGLFSEAGQLEEEDDAFGLLLRGVWRRSLDPARQAAGRRTQEHAVWEEAG